MDRDEVREGILALLQELHEDIDFEAESKMVDDKVLDSFDLASLVTELSDNFEIEIAAEKVNADNFNSIDDIADMIIGIVEG